jgi:integrase
MPEHWRPYDWRHCHATTLLERGTPLPFVSKRLGHKNTAITGTIYSALRPSENVRLARLFGDAMGPPESEAADAAAE